MQHILTAAFYISENNLTGNTVSYKELKLHFIVFFLGFADIDLLFKEGT